MLWKHELIASMGKRHVKNIRDLFSRPSMVKGMRTVRAKLWGVWQPLTANMSQSQVVKQFELYSVGLLKTEKMLDVRYLCFKNSILGATCGKWIRGRSSKYIDHMSKGGYLLNFYWIRITVRGIEPRILVWISGMGEKNQARITPVLPEKLSKVDGRKCVYGGEWHRQAGRSGFNLKRMRCFWQMEIQIWNLGMNRDWW